MVRPRDEDTRRPFSYLFHQMAAYSDGGDDSGGGSEEVDCKTRHVECNRPTNRTNCK